MSLSEQFDKKLNDVIEECRQEAYARGCSPDEFNGELVGFLILTAIGLAKGRGIKLPVMVATLHTLLKKVYG